MRNSNRELKAVVNAYILNAIDSTPYDIETTTDKEKLQFLADTFKNEYCYADNLKRYGSYQNTLANYIMGLPTVFNVAFENYDIIQIAIKWGTLNEDSTEKQQDKVISNWFGYIACKTLQLFGKHHISL